MNAKKRATAKDVAALAGVSRSAVSMFINGQGTGNIASDKQQRIQEAMAQLNYTPNAVAQSLKNQRTLSIGIISDKIATSPWAGPMLLAASETAAERGYLTVHVETAVDYMDDAPLALKKITEATKVLQNRSMDGYLYMAMGHGNIDLPAPLLDMPVVLANCSSIDQDIISVTPDDELGAYGALQHLLALGHRRITVLTGDDVNLASVLRKRGCQKALADWRKANPKLQAEVTFIARGWGIAQGYAATTKLLQQPRTAWPTALFCINDRCATGAYLALSHNKLSVPGDMSIVGFDDEVELAAQLQPPLTTMALPHKELGATSMNTLLNLIEGKEVPDHSVRVPCPLIQRASVAKA